MGAIDPTRWHSWHFACKIGATSLANVTDLPAGCEPPSVVASAAIAGPDSVRKALNASTPMAVTRYMENSVFVIPAPLAQTQIAGDKCICLKSRCQRGGGSGVAFRGYVSRLRRGPDRVSEAT